MQRITTTLTGSPRARAVIRILGALLLIFVGLDHYYEYSVQSYSVLPTIGTLFLLNFISASAIGLVLLLPIERVARQAGRVVERLAAISGLGIATTSLAALLASEQTRIFGFMESNYRPEIVIAIASEAAAAVLLALLAISTTRSVHQRRPRVSAAH
jgi:hypothetical protein